MALDLSKLDHLFKGNRVRVQEWIHLYAQESPAYFEQLVIALGNGDAGAMASAAHDLQPQAHYLGSERMRALLSRIEEEARTNNVAACSGPLSELLSLRTVIDDELRAFLGDEKNR